jgi:hypothetical protein
MDEDVVEDGANHPPPPLQAQRAMLLIAGGVGVAALVLTLIADVTWHSQPTVIQLPERLRQLQTPPALPTFPTGLPSAFPTDLPSDLPSGFPTDLPTGFPTDLPGFPTDLPTDFPELPELPEFPGGNS